MATSLTARKKDDEDYSRVDMTLPVQPESGQETCESTPFSNDAQTLLLKAHENAIFAKEAAMDAINRVYKESEASAEALAKVINEAMQCNVGRTNESRSSGTVESPTEADQENREAGTPEHHTKSMKPGLVQKILNNRHHPLNTFLGNKATDNNSEEGNDTRHL